VGQQVHAALAGVVTFAGRLAGRGVVVVDHGSLRTTYEPVGASVQVGDRVGAGEVIGRLQLFGSHCFPGACLHWGLIEGRDHYLDPLTLVGAAPVRLLPLGGLAQQGPPSLPARPPVPAAGTPPPAAAASAMAGTVLEPAMALAVQARGWAWR
jgi:murein DD-endopeptidase MepM/ murein hydrolase activator NlpD